MPPETTHNCMDVTLQTPRKTGGSLFYLSVQATDRSAAVLTRQGSRPASDDALDSKRILIHEH